MQVGNNLHLGGFTGRNHIWKFIMTADRPGSNPNVETISLDSPSMSAEGCQKFVCANVPRGGLEGGGVLQGLC